ncbi:hypothetical protein DM01DRAFT_1342158 [Hesseltinella vesiculosa]|uniref:CAP-Gly domain-containing protein n=1 Tax=Hesseltinella vesiculosa TaxID=101127 RepID=A0A1X2GWA0_9FUNG|nr:hypothetical protein DM01DRAFT_1342158 [Hesseltinella vesiculosa]
MTQPSSILVHSRSYIEPLKPILTNHSSIHPSGTPSPPCQELGPGQDKADAPQTVLPNPPPTPPLPLEPLPSTIDTKLAEQLQSLTADNLEVLLSMETQARMDRIEEQRELDEELKKKEEQERIPRRLKFALPETPLRTPATPPPPDDCLAQTSHALTRTSTTPVGSTHDTSQLQKRWSLPEDGSRQQPQLHTKKRKKWTKFFLPKTANDELLSGATVTSIELSRRAELSYGNKVKLIRSPLKTTAFVRYIGPVHWAEGEWIGVELERAVGKNDGSVNGRRYFYTGANRGIFLTKDELMVV